MDILTAMARILKGVNVSVIQSHFAHCRPCRILAVGMWLYQCQKQEVLRKMEAE